MNFDHHHKPNRDNLTPAMAATVDKVFYARRRLGLNVQFISNGKLDEWSFTDISSRDQFIARLKLSNQECAFYLNRKEALAAEYLELIGYDPFTDDPAISMDEVEQTLKEWYLIQAREVQS